MNTASDENHEIINISPWGATTVPEIFRKVNVYPYRVLLGQQLHKTVNVVPFEAPYYFVTGIFKIMVFIETSTNLRFDFMKDG